MENHLSSVCVAEVNASAQLPAKTSSNPRSRKPKQENTTKSYSTSFNSINSDQTLALKLFGNVKASLNKRSEQNQLNCSWIIHPSSTFRLLWDGIMLLVLLGNLFVVPVVIAFMYDDDSHGIITFYIICDSCFICDILLTFRTGFVDPLDKRKIIRDGRVIAISYLKSWFALDVISTLPIDYAFLHTESGSPVRLLRLLRLFQLFKLFRISRLIKRINALVHVSGLHHPVSLLCASRLSPSLFINALCRQVVCITLNYILLKESSGSEMSLHIAQVLFYMVFVSHWSGCLMYLGAVLQGFPNDCWVVIEKIQDLPWFEKYVHTLLKSVSITVGLGYGLLPPLNTIDTWICIAACIAGFATYTLLISHAQSLLQSVDKSGKKFRAHMQQVGEFMKYRRLPSRLRKRILDYYFHRYNGKLFSEKTILDDLSDCLRQEVYRHICDGVIKSIPFLVDAEPSFVDELISQLSFELYQPGDVIFEVQAKGEKLFLIQEGVVELVSTEGNIITTLSEGSFFGEISLLTRKPSPVSARAVSYCSFFTLSKEDVNTMLQSYPLMRETLESVAAERLGCLGKDPQEFALKKQPVSLRMQSCAASANGLDAANYTDDINPCHPSRLQKIQHMLMDFINADGDEIMRQT